MKGLESRKHIIVGLSLVILFVPLIAIQVIPTDSPQPYMFKVRISSKLDETTNGHRQYFFMEWLEGDEMAPAFVVLIDSAYTRGQSNAVLEPNQEFWCQGSLIKPGEGLDLPHMSMPQFYVRQIKGSILWPDQVTELKLLYLAPIFRLSDPPFVVLLPFMEEFTLGTYLVVILQTIVILTTVYLLVKHRRDPGNRVIILLGYILLTMILTIPRLTELY